MKRPHIWLLVGLALGLAAGLVYTWVLNPVEFYDTYPPLMREDFRRDWIRMTGLAYGNDGDLERARLRLKDLSRGEIQDALAQTLDAAVDSGRPLPALRRLAALARDYGVDSAAVRIYTAEEVRLPTPAPTSTATPSPTVTPTAIAPTPTPTPMGPTATATPEPILTPIPHVILPTPTPLPPPYAITQTLESCLPEPHIAVSLTQNITITVRGREQRQVVGLPGREVWLLWPGGADRAFTGLRPAQGLGYADFVVEPQQSYNLYIETPTGAPLATLQVAPCVTAEGENGWSAWLVILKAAAAAEP